MADKVSLLLKRGLHENLPKQGQFENGTLYFTTNEGGLYLGLAEGKGVRMQGSVLYFTDLQTFYNEVKPPYSTDVLYFIEKTIAADGSTQVFNALMRWDGTKWIQINATAESFQAALDDLKDTKERVESLEEKVGAPAHKDAEGNDVAASGLFETVGVVRTDVDTLISAVGAPAHKDAEGNDVAASGLFADVAKNAADISANSELIGANAKDIEAINKSIGDLEDADDAINEEIGKINEALALKADKSTVNDLDEEVDGIDERLQAVEQNLGVPEEKEGDTVTQQATGLFAEVAKKANQDEVDDIDDRVGNIETNLGVPEIKNGDTVTQQASGLFKTVAEQAGQISELDKAIGENAEEIEKHDDRLADLEAALGTGGTGTGSISQRVDDLERDAKDIKDQLAEIPNTYATKEELGDVEENLAKELNDHILAANAMRYKGSVDGENTTLPTSGVSIGDTYIASAPFKHNGEQVYAGDLLVANGTEDEDATSETFGQITSNLTWSRVDTGYIEAHENALEVDADNGAINLMSHLGAALSSIKINSVSNNVTVAFDETNQAISIGMVWDTF
jgi:predicted  nucleic acid-binding Zn-ribbon protein